ncbi:MAG: hypothetical protein ACREDO_00195 [Methyloceanibacter sp.]
MAQRIGGVEIVSVAERRERLRAQQGPQPDADVAPRKGPAFPISALRSHANGEELFFELDHVQGRNVVRIRVMRDGRTMGEVAFDADHLTAFRGAKLHKELLLPAWRLGLLGDWVLVGPSA